MRVTHLKSLQFLLTLTGFLLLIFVFIAIPLVIFLNNYDLLNIIGIAYIASFVLSFFEMIKNFTKKNIALYHILFFVILALIPFGSIYSRRWLHAMINGWQN